MGTRDEIESEEDVLAAAIWDARSRLVTAVPGQWDATFTEVHALIRKHERAKLARQISTKLHASAEGHRRDAEACRASPDLDVDGPMGKQPSEARYSDATADAQENIADDIEAWLAEPEKWFG